MGHFILDKNHITKLPYEGKESIKIVNKEAFDKFDESTLGLGNISADSKPINALAAVFDLSGFTKFCSQPDIHLVVPEFLNDYLKWIYERIRVETIARNFDSEYEVWSDLPFYSKFLGDGILLLWDTACLDKDEICNIIIALKKICEAYSNEFVENMSEQYPLIPFKLRCGIAQGNVFNLGENNDYIGPCINLASRLQKLADLSFCFAKRGIDIKKHMGITWHNDFVVKKVNIRGIAEKELVGILREEYNLLEPEDKKLFI